MAAPPSKRKETIMSDNNWMLPDKGEAQKRGILACLGIACAIVTVLVFSVLFFTEISFTVESILSLSVQFALLFFSSYVMYFSLFETGKDKGEREEEVRATAQRNSALLRRYEKEGAPDTLLAFCLTQTEKERREAHRFLLSRFSMTEAESEALLKSTKGSLRDRARRHALMRVSRIRITPAMLLLGRKAGKYTAPLSHSPERMRLRRAALFMLFAAVTAAFSVSLVFEMLFSPDPSTVAAYLLKLFALFGSGARGYRAGYLHATGDVPHYQKEQNHLLEEYFRTLSHAHTSKNENKDLQNERN